MKTLVYTGTVKFAIPLPEGTGAENITQLLTQELLRRQINPNMFMYNEYEVIEVEDEERNTEEV